MESEEECPSNRREVDELDLEFSTFATLEFFENWEAACRFRFLFVI